MIHLWSFSVTFCKPISYANFSNNFNQNYKGLVNTLIPFSNRLYYLADSINEMKVKDNQAKIFYIEASTLLFYNSYIQKILYRLMSM